MFTGIIIGAVAGIVTGLLIAFVISPSLMFRENKYNKEFETTVSILQKEIEEKG